MIAMSSHPPALDMIELKVAATLRQVRNLTR